MNFSNNKEHSFDFLFSILLFFLFTASALMLILIGTKVYQSSSSRMEENYTLRTALTYITEKIRQTDTAGSIELSDIQGTPALTLKQEINGISYSTYIYEHNNSLKELFIKSSSDVTLDMGISIIELDSLSIEKLEGGFFQITATDGDQKSVSSLIYPSSQKEAT